MKQIREPGFYWISVSGSEPQIGELRESGIVWITDSPEDFDEDEISFLSTLLIPPATPKFESAENLKIPVDKEFGAG